jgi:NAD(P)-dependent dehydrogenase (short-subunit alcohol dehydrogenase family)
MQDKPVALVTGANKGIGLQIAKDLVAHGFTAYRPNIRSY